MIIFFPPIRVAFDHVSFPPLTWNISCFLSFMTLTVLKAVGQWLHAFLNWMGSFVSSEGHWWGTGLLSVLRVGCHFPLPLVTVPDSLCICSLFPCSLQASCRGSKVIQISCSPCERPLWFSIHSHPNQSFLDGYKHGHLPMVVLNMHRVLDSAPSTKFWWCKWL